MKSIHTDTCFYYKKYSSLIPSQTTTSPLFHLLNLYKGTVVKSVYQNCTNSFLSPQFMQKKIS